jgi:uncharacterized protein YegL
MSDLQRPGGEMTTRPLHFIWIADCSGSMETGGKIQALNAAVREAIPHMRNEASQNPNATVLVRVLKFSDGAQWLVSQPTKVSEFEWTDLTAGGVTDMGKALSMVAEQLKMPPMDARALPPVLVLISDGQPTDAFSQGLNDLMKEPWGKKAVRIAIGIGEDVDPEVLQKFIGNAEIKPVQANNPEALVRQIRWASTVVLKAASSPAAQPMDAGGGIAAPPIPMVADTPDDAGDASADVW